MKSLTLSILFCCIFLTEYRTTNVVNSSTLTFDQKITLRVSSTQDDNVDVDYFFNSSDTSLLCMRMRSDLESNSQESVFFVFKNDKIEMLMNVAGMKMRKSVNKEEFNNYSQLGDIPEQSEIKKTGETKSILGYICEAYKVTSSEGVFTAWVCPNFPITNTFVPMIGMHANSPFKGFVMELNTTAASEKANLKVTAIDLNASLRLDLNAYKNFKF